MVLSAETFISGPLTIELSQNDDGISVIWYGRSTARNPSEFVRPILSKAIDVAESSKLPMTIDFRDLEYLNSSTITPIIRLLERAKQGTAKLCILYRSDLKWQSLSFSALHLFRTADARIEVRSEDP